MRQYFYFLYKFVGISGWKRLGQLFWIVIWIYYYLQNGIRLELDLSNFCGIRKMPYLATNNINILFFTHQPYSDLGKSNLLNLIVSLTA